MQCSSSLSSFWQVVGRSPLLAGPEWKHGVGRSLYLLEWTSKQVKGHFTTIKEYEREGDTALTCSFESDHPDRNDCTNFLSMCIFC
jgi:hypothetical protein